MIFGPIDGEEGGGYPYKGRGPEKYFLYEIISNKLTGVDVDKFDYFLRDSQATGLKITFDYNRVLDDMRVVDNFVEKYGVSVKRIAFRDKTLPTFQKMFADRFQLHHACYQHKVVKCIDTMLVDAWLHADPHVPKTRGLRLSEQVKDVRALVNLTDYSVTQGILSSEDPNLQQAKNILTRINKRDLYRLVAEMTGDVGKTDQELQEELGCNLAVGRTVIDYGQKEKNPVTAILFYDKLGRISTKTDEDLLNFVPKKISYEKVYVFLRDSGAEGEARAVRQLRSMAQNNKDVQLTFHVPVD